MPTSSFEDYVGTVDAYIGTRPDMAAVRAYNHQMIDILDSLRPVAGKSLLDVGASPHGFALERALRKNVSGYTGIGLGVQETVEVIVNGAASEAASRRASLGEAFRRIAGATPPPEHHRTEPVVGRLMQMDAESLLFEPNTFDLLLSLSTFEHFFDGARVLREMHRVLKPGGSALISFQPVWTCSYGHHLHHVEPVAALIPPWAHLLWTEQTMRQAFEGRWPEGLPMSLEASIEWIYRSNEVNRIDVVRIRQMFLDCDFEIEWMTPLMDSEGNDKRVIVNYLAVVCGYKVEDLMTLGYSLLLNRR